MTTYPERQQNSHLYIASQPALRMPFSSPTAEEILSPASPGSSYSSSQPWKTNRVNRNGKENNYFRKSSLVQKTPKREPSRKHERNQNKGRWPGLNLVTNFSRSPILVHRPADVTSQHGRKKELNAEDAKPGFITLSEVKPPIDKKGDRGFKTHMRNKSSGATLRSDLELRNHEVNREKSTYDSSEGATGLGLQNYDNPPDYDSCLLSDNKDRLNGLKPSPIKLTELSPSDRPIVIGISIPSARLAEHSMSPEVGLTPLTSRGHTINRDPPVTPTIIVTPARHDEPWSDAFGEGNRALPSRRRVTSSIYSRATQYGQGWTPQMNIPPVPAPPQGYVNAKHGGFKNRLEDDDRIDMPPRVDSNDTIFEEDNQENALNQNRSNSWESPILKSKPSGINQKDRRHASQGWWNYILSPFATRSNTMMFRGGSPKSAGPNPALSSPDSEVASPHDQHAQQLNQVHPPSKEKSIGKGIDRTSFGADHARFEKDNTGLAFDHTLSTRGPSGLNSPTSFDGFGAAAEYYNACWHDQNSPTPYFECQNHFCFPLDRGNIAAPDNLLKSTEGRDAARGLSGTEDDGHDLGGFRQTPANRFSAAFSNANRLKARPLSEATDIEDLDETPVVHEARAAPVVHASAPFTAIPVAAAIAKAPPIASATAAPNANVYNTIHLYPSPSRNGLSEDAVSASASQPPQSSSVNRLPLSSAMSEEPQGNAGSPQPSQPSIQQMAPSANFQRAPKRFVAVKPPDQVTPTQEAPTFSKSSLSSGPSISRQLPATESPSSSSQMPPITTASRPFLSEATTDHAFTMTSGHAHLDHTAYRSPISHEPSVTSTPQEPSGTFPSRNAASEALPSSNYAKSRAPPPRVPPSSETPAISAYSRFAPSTIPQPDHPNSFRQASSRMLTVNDSASRVAPSQPPLPFEAPLSSEFIASEHNPFRPLSSSNSISGNPPFAEPQILPQPHPSSHITASDVPEPSEYTTSRALLSNGRKSSNKPLLPVHTPSDSTQSFNPSVPSGAPISSRYVVSDSQPSKNATMVPRPTEVADPPFSLSSNNASSSLAPSSAAPKPAADVSSRYMTSELQPKMSTAPPAVEQISSEPYAASHLVVSSVAQSSGFPLTSKYASSSYKTLDNLPLSAPTNMGEPTALPGPPQPPANESSATQIKSFPRKAVPRNEYLDGDQQRSVPQTYVVNNYYHGLGPRGGDGQIPTASLEPPLDHSYRSDKAWEVEEKNGIRSRERKSNKYLNCRNCFNRDKTTKRPMTKKKQRLLWGIAVSLVILIILILALVMTLTRKGDKSNIQSQWLNITGFPPIPTGISTIVQPDAVHESSSCVQPATMWSCAAPKEEQQSIAPNDPDQPNFRVEIIFQNGTTSNLTLSTSKSKKGSHIQRRLLDVGNAFNSNLFSPSPPPPSEEDQIFLGNSTDKITAPFDGESTPFFISFLSASKLPQRRLAKRQKSQSGNSTDPFPDLTEGIPPPDVNPDGTAASANLLPFPTAQPLRLYDRGLVTEHYGFYNYFDRSIFLESTSLLNDTGPSTGDVPDDQDGGAERSSARVRCTWRQTRFLVQIWTNQGATSPLLGSANHTSGEKDSPPKNLTESTANDFTRPGSFPYPVTVTLDRHGGNLDNKFIYCYGMDNRGHIISDEKKIQLEDRASGGGVVVNPAQGLFGNVKVTKAEGGPGGIDGGTGGCGCQWSNFGS